MSLFGDWGYLGLFLGCFLAATIFPFSSDALFVASLGLGGSVTLTLFWGTLGNWLGSLTSYWVGYAGKWEWIEKWFKVKRETLEKQKSKVNKYGSLLALLTWLPFIGDIFAIALGFYKTKFWPTAIFMLIGKLLRFVIITIVFLYFADKLEWFVD
ncbi:YqaA family protein [Bacteroides sp. 519]|uniref:YqaA family protein n=1 Tax=Bacteroides sp. 519 TaxID=2302937 RepID=UPI0013D2ACF7|nr:YqaA family protein [Bacteroides sp. 519]NDV56955.1 DedA family protein [Bacteroides sp. 519]